MPFKSLAENQLQSKNRLTVIHVLVNIVAGLYRLVISPMVHLWAGPGFGCRFEPTCSRYANEALKLHGPLNGSFLTIKRISRCNPFARAGYDPVPHAIAKSCSNYY